MFPTSSNIFKPTLNVMHRPSKLPDVGTTIFAIMSKMAADHQALNLSQGFPNFESDPLLIEGVAKAMRDGFNQYAPMQGDMGLREVVCDKMKSLYGQTYDLGTEITITAGATQAIFTAIAACIHAGDEVIAFAPAYDCYEPAVRLFGGTTHLVQLEPPRFTPDWEAVKARINPKTRMIIINTPHNPTGTLLSREDLLQLQKLAVEHNLLVLSDEVYEHIVFDGEQHQSVARFPELAARSFITASFGKTFHNTGWKMGYCLAPEPLMVEFQKVHQYNVFSVNHPIQKALADYLKKPEHYLSLGDFYQQKRDRFLNAIENSRFRFVPSKGTYFQLLDYTEISDRSDMEMAQWLTVKHKLSTIPTSVFNNEQKDFRQLRICFAKTDDTLDQAAAILNGI